MSLSVLLLDHIRMNSCKWSSDIVAIPLIVIVDATALNTYTTGVSVDLGLLVVIGE